MPILLGTSLANVPPTLYDSEPESYYNHITATAFLDEGEWSWSVYFRFTLSITQPFPSHSLERTRREVPF